MTTTVRGAVAPYRDFYPELFALRPHLVIYLTIARVQLRGKLVFGERLFELSGRRQAARAHEMILRGPYFRALERRARVRVVGMLAQRFRVFDDGDVVFLALFRLTPAVHCAGRCAADGQDACRYGACRFR